MKGRPQYNLEGQRFGRLLVETRLGVSKSGNVLWQCRCDCGNVKSVGSNNLRNPTRGAKSCGCLYRERRGKPRYSRRRTGTAFRMVLRSYEQGAKRKGLPFELTDDFFLELTQRTCFYCGSLPANKKVSPAGEIFLYSGVDRKDSEKGYTVSNTVACCCVCNMLKGALDQQEFLKQIKTIARFRR